MFRGVAVKSADVSSRDPSEVSIHDSGNAFESITLSGRDTYSREIPHAGGTASALDLKFCTSGMRAFAHRLSPDTADAGLEFIDRADKLIASIRPNALYSVAGAIHFITTGKKDTEANGQAVAGSALIHDLCRLAEYVTRRSRLSSKHLREDYYTPAQVAEELCVREKSVRDWRTEGLITLPILFSDGRRHLVVLKSVFDRFVKQNAAVIPGQQIEGNFNDEQRLKIVGRAWEIVTLDKSVSLYRAAAKIAGEMNLEPKAVRAALRLANSKLPAEAKLFSEYADDNISERNREIINLSTEGASRREIARMFQCSAVDVGAVLRKGWVLTCKAEVVKFIDSELFDDPEEVKKLLRAPAPDAQGNSANPGHVQSTGGYVLHGNTSVLSTEDERMLSRKHNYLKGKFIRELGEVDPELVTSSEQKRLRRMYCDSFEPRSEFINRNIPLGISVARLEERKGRTRLNFDELMSECHFGLLRAADGFDASRGFKFSTYGVNSLRRNLQRALAKDSKIAQRYSDESEVIIALAEDRRSDANGNLDSAGIMEMLHSALSELEPRERYVLEHRYGISNGGIGQTLDEIGEHFGVTKERVRQIQVRAERKLKEMLPESVRLHVA